MTHSRKAKILLVVRLVISSLAALIGFGLLSLTIFSLVAYIFETDYIRYYILPWASLSAVFGLVLFVPGIYGLRDCIKRLRGR